MKLFINENQLYAFYRITIGMSRNEALAIVAMLDYTQPVEFIFVPEPGLRKVRQGSTYIIVPDNVLYEAENVRPT